MEQSHLEPEPMTLKTCSSNHAFIQDATPLGTCQSGTCQSGTCQSGECSATTINSGNPSENSSRSTMDVPLVNIKAEPTVQTPVVKPPAKRGRPCNPLKLAQRQANQVAASQAVAQKEVGEAGLDLLCDAVDCDKSPNKLRRTQSEPVRSNASLEKRKHVPRRAGITWTIGCKIEAMDYLRKWYPAKIVEVNEQEMKVLIHFDGWNSRFDEWLDMRSERLRAASNTAAGDRLPEGNRIEQGLTVGSVVLARWRDCGSNRYPAVIKGLVEEGLVSLEFYDGMETTATTSMLQLLSYTLQQEALHIWDIMREINDASPIDVSALSRREAIEVRKAEQAKMDAAEKLLSLLIEKASKVTRDGKECEEKDNPKSEGRLKVDVEDTTSQDSPESTKDITKKKKTSDSLSLMPTIVLKRRPTDAGALHSSADDEKPRKVGRKKKLVVAGMFKAVTSRKRSANSEKLSPDSRDALPGRQPEPSSLKEPLSQAKAGGQKTPVGYVTVTEPAVPSKAFVVEEDHNHYKCPMCSKGFRKGSLLNSHIKHYHSAETTGPDHSVVRRNKTISLCSSDSETVASSAIVTPLASPSGSRGFGSRGFADLGLESASEDVPYHGQVDYGADTDLAESDASGLYDDNNTDVINCRCGRNEAGELMIQCEFCCCWQHAACFNMTQLTLPNRYLCFICLDTPGVRESSRYLFNQDWYRQGKLPTFGFVNSLSDISRRRSTVLRSHKKLDELQLYKQALNGLHRLTAAVERKDAEVYLWRENIDSVGATPPVETRVCNPSVISSGQRQNSVTTLTPSSPADSSVYDGMVASSAPNPVTTLTPSPTKTQGNAVWHSIQNKQEQPSLVNDSLAESCCQNALKYISKSQDDIMRGLDAMELAISELEAEAGITTSDDITSVSKNLQALLTDLGKVHMMAALSTTKEST